MSFFQNLWRDLVEKRLWPVAAALVVAAVAIPLLIGGGSSDTAAAPAPLPGEQEAALVPSTPQVTVAGAPSDVARSRAGASRDPFKPLVFAKAPKAAVATSATGAASTVATAATSSSTKPATSGGSTPTAGSTSTGSSSSSSSGSSGSGSSGTATTVTPKVTTPATVKPSLTKFVYALTLTLKRSGQKSMRHNLQAVSYVPSPSAPLLAFLGVRADGRTATFLVGDRVTVSGNDLVCRPSLKDCRFLEIKQGANILFSKTPVRGTAKHYRLVLNRVALVPVSKATKAAAARRIRAAGSAAAPELAPAQLVGSGR
ncbi:hypothetical protein NBH00_14425 [Paraconexibacter antarcticus]|uniref:Uncharacterized protein n=1 Tax=Paraconexibacter antarcticus TaxID=2949664 RepID=A0ABY5DL70_9ACTN|nr:hypothetical protein [Paraconexibacter antarcticus]UTI62555.1 hypothetical protein NBH00_14425 [Paraconexibacter antarcticus]